MSKNQQQGFTLVELMIVLVLLAIVASMALPNFNQLINSNQVLAQANELERFLQYARSQAVVTQRHYKVGIEGREWAVKPLNAGGDERRYQLPASLKISQNFSDSAIIFSPSGTATAGAIRLCRNETPEQPKDGYQIDVIKTGVIKLYSRGMDSSKALTKCKLN